RTSMGFNAGTISNDWEPKKLMHDRDIEFALDPMDIDETNLVLEVANIQNVFEEEQAIPEKDSYRFSKLYAEAKTYASKGAVIDNTVLTATTILDWFDTQMEKMDDNAVPLEGRILYVTPAMNKLLKNASQIQRSINVNSNNGNIDRRVYSLDDVKIIKVPSARFKTKYDFTDGCVPASSAKQINMILIHPSCVVSRDKYAYMKLFTPGTDSRTADKYVYQNRYYTDTFLIENKACGIAINAEAEN
ncbi:MAG: capsid protein, partial [Clostridium sp.]